MSQPDVMLYALSTCIHCRHTREYLEKNHIAYDYIYVDQATGQERDQAIAKVRELNPRLSFPTMVVGPSQTTVIGFNPESIQAALAS